MTAADDPSSVTDVAPTFIACGARSGSTVLRWLIDAHPDVVCPGETDLAVLVNLYRTSAAALSGAGHHAGPSPEHAARAVADGLMARCLDGTGKHRWCDKSLSNVFHLELLAEVWPDARFILLHRHVMDVVVSAIEASPWGLAEYGFAQVAQRSPTDHVAAIAAYWIDRTARMLAFEDRHGARCLRVRYEDLASSPETVLPAVFARIGVSDRTSEALEGFAADHSTFGAADHKIWYTDAVHGRSVGRGARVPPEKIPAVLRGSLNPLLERLEYATIDDGWGSGGARPLAAAGRRDAAPTSVRIVEGHRLVDGATVDLVDGAWSVAADAPFVVVIEAPTLATLRTSPEELGGALRARTVRWYGELPPAFNNEREVFARLVALLDPGVPLGGRG